MLWREKLDKAVKQCWDTQPPSTENIKVTITYFFHGASLDVDNMPKPILDAFNGSIYLDDSQVTDLICRKRDLTKDLPIENPSYQLLEKFADSEQPVHITMTNALDQEVTTW